MDLLLNEMLVQLGKELLKQTMEHVVGDFQTSEVFVIKHVELFYFVLLPIEHLEQYVECIISIHVCEQDSSHEAQALHVSKVLLFKA